MKQSNCYLYEYENNRQVRNVGFVKYIQEENKIIFQIHGKGMNCSKNEQYELYIFAGKSEACYVSRAGAVETEQGRINYMVTVEGFSQEQFNNYDGIYLHVSGEKKYVAMWNKSAVCFDRVESYDYLMREESCDDPIPHHNHENAHNHEDDCDEQDNCCEQNTSHHNQCRNGDHHNHEKSSEQYQNGDCHNHEESCDQCHGDHQKAHQHHQDYVLNDCLCEEEIEEVITGPCEQDFQEEEAKNSDITYEKIERQDIAKLSQREWKLANNSFLLHGYHNYQHILFIQEAGRSFIGVPGIYAPREADAAKNFGFPVFHRVGRHDMQWDEGEREYNVDFGYWCREVMYHKERF